MLSDVNPVGVRPAIDAVSRAAGMLCTGFRAIEQGVSMSHLTSHGIRWRHWGRALVALMRLMTRLVGAQADILMVTDGQIPNPSPQLLDRIATARGELGLEVHGLIVGDRTQARCAPADQSRAAP